MSRAPEIRCALREDLLVIERDALARTVCELNDHLTPVRERRIHENDATLDALTELVRVLLDRSRELRCDLRRYLHL
jgi:hypothetical protein